MSTVTLALHAMATRFELVLNGENPVSLRAAGEEAMAEIERLENQLSLFRPSSEISHLNARAATEPVRVTPALFALLQQAQAISTATAGAFDITVAPLVRCWGFMAGTGRVPPPDELAEARSRVGMHLVELEPLDFTVRFARPGVMLDLGAIGKGYAIDCAALLLREAGVTSCLIHGGTSTVYAIGSLPNGGAWKVEIDNPEPAPPAQSSTPMASGYRIRRKPTATAKPAPAPARAPFAVVPLRDESLSVSAVSGKSFEAEGRTFGHILDPRTGVPASHAVLSAVVLPSATETDALSTALLTLGAPGCGQIARFRPQVRALVVGLEGGLPRITANGILAQAAPG